MSVDENLHQILNDAAASYLQLGWSIVPLWGDSKPGQAKVAAVAWSPFQRRRANDTEIAHWFTRMPCAGLGIVTGAVSQLVVLDFDDPELSKRFAAQYPELTATRTVITRRGRHLYFRVPPHLRIASRKLAGVDLLSDGHYVVAPPTLIDGHEYRIERGGLPRALDQTDIISINAFLDRLSQNRPVAAVESPELASKVYLAERTKKTREGAASGEDKSLLSATSLNPAEDTSFLTAEALVRFYRGLARQTKRNIALFRTSCLARDHGWKYEAVVAILAGVHATEMPVGQHRCENARVRYREAVRTIRSAFTKPPRPLQPPDSGGLFNSIREKLMQLGQTYLVRVLEGLRLAGMKAGQLVTERSVLQLLRGIVGRHSVRLALAAKTPAGKPIFKPVRSPRYPPRCAAATQLRIDRQTNAYVNRAKPDKSLGRPQQHYRIPSPETLCTRLGVTPSGSDPVTLDDLQTAKKTRQALHRELIRRRPGLYLRQWLGDRLGVSETTVWRYCRQLVDVQVTPTFTQTPLGWHNLNAIPASDAAPGGICLEDSTGKRWPALKGVAQKLLGQGRGVRLLVRSLNYYWYGHGDPPADANGLRAEWRLEEVKQADTELLTFRQSVAHLVRIIGANRLPVAEVVFEPTKQKPIPVPQPVAKPVAERHKRKHKQRYWKPLKHAEAEALAVEVYDALNQRTEKPDERVSLVTARRWVDAFGIAAVANALQTLRTRQNVVRPAGWLQTVLRSAAKFA